MDVIAAILGICLIVSIAFNIYQFFKIRSIKANPTPSKELIDFINDLSQDRAFIEIKHVSPESFLWRQPL